MLVKPHKTLLSAIHQLPANHYCYDVKQPSFRICRLHVLAQPVCEEAAASAIAVFVEKLQPDVSESFAPPRYRNLAPNDKAFDSIEAIWSVP